MAPVLNEQSRRRFVALEAQSLGRGGVSLMARISGLARSTIYQGLSDVCNKAFTSDGRIRKEGGGRKKKAIQDPTLVVDLTQAIDRTTTIRASLRDTELTLLLAVGLVTIVIFLFLPDIRST